MNYPRSILRGYSKDQEALIAKALGMALPGNKHRKGGERRHMKIPMSALKKDVAAKPKDKKKSVGMKFGMIKGKKNDNDVDDK